MSLPQKIAQAMPSDNGLVIGTIATLNPLTVNVRGGIVNNPGLLDDSRPIPLQVGDTVALLRQDQTWLMLGAVSAGSVAQYPLMQAGQALLSFTAQTSATLAVVFSVPFQSTPSVVATIASGSGNANLWFVRVTSVTTLGFTILVSAALANTWTNFPVHWQAQVMTQ